jgi:hypothetical protein
VPLVVLVVDILLDVSIVDNDGSETFLVITRVEGLAAFFDLVQQLGPFFNIVTNHVIDLSTLEVPESLVLTPDVEVLLGSLEY